MQPVILRVPLVHLVAIDVHPLTRESVIDFARRTNEGKACEVHIVVTVGHEDDGLDIELAAVELNAAPDGSWRLQYISHPAQSGDITAGIAPSTSDFAAFIQAREAKRLPSALTPLCASELDAEGLGPLAALNLRLENLVPVLPSRSNLDQLMALADTERRLNADAGQSSKDGPGSV